MSHSRLAVELTRGRSFSWVIPVTSALNICIPPDELSIGMTASVKSIIPIPPIHCISARHISTECDRALMSSATDTPVVEKADMDSKNASVNLIGVEQSMNGTRPKNENTIQTSAVSRNPSRLPM